MPNAVARRVSEAEAAARDAALSRFVDVAHSPLAPEPAVRITPLSAALWRARILLDELT